MCNDKNSIFQKAREAFDAWGHGISGGGQVFCEVLQLSFLFHVSIGHRYTFLSSTFAVLQAVKIHKQDPKGKCLVSSRENVCSNYVMRSLLMYSFHSMEESTVMLRACNYLAQKFLLSWGIRK